MYGTEAGTATTALAATGIGLGVGSNILAAVGLVLAGIALWMLARKNREVRP